MDPERNTEELLRQLLAYEKRQLRHTRMATFINILLVLAVLAALVLLVPKALHSLAEVDRLATSAQELIDNTNTMVAENTDAVTETIRKLSDVDFDSLNSTIHDLEDAIRPVAELARKLTG